MVPSKVVGYAVKGRATDFSAVPDRPMPGTISGSSAYCAFLRAARSFFPLVGAAASAFLPKVGKAKPAFFSAIMVRPLWRATPRVLDGVKASEPAAKTSARVAKVFMFGR